MKIAMLASESNPYCKTGGLADVVFSLSKELVKQGHEVMVCLPFYESIKDQRLRVKALGSFKVSMSWRKQEAEIFEEKKEGVRFIFIGNHYYFDRERIYGYNDDGERFAFFQLACRQMLEFISFKADIVHLHDWQTAMIPCLIKEQNFKSSFYRDMKFVLTIHNPAFKGLIDRYFLNDFYSLPDSLYDCGKVRFDGMVSTLKSGIVYTDKITTVSPTHRSELLTQDLGQGLAGILELRKDDFVGIVNGVDTDEWDPSSDPFLVKTYDGNNLVEGKQACQADLLEEFGIHWFGGPVYGMVSRLSWQKGLSICYGPLRRALLRGANVIILGSGEYELERKLQDLRDEFPDTMAIYIGYSNKLAHKIYAGSDYFLMPSLFEPCGISQMIAQRYGCLPIVRYTGGLVDTVTGYQEDNLDQANGIGFRDFDEQGLEYALGLAKKLNENQDDYYRVSRNATEVDHTWGRSAGKYEELYESLLKKSPR